MDLEVQIIGVQIIQQRELQLLRTEQATLIQRAVGKMFPTNLLQTQIELLVLLTNLRLIRVGRLIVEVLTVTVLILELLEIAVNQNRVLATEHKHRKALRGKFQRPLQDLLDQHRAQEALRVTPDHRVALLAADQVVLLAVLEEDN